MSTMEISEASGLAPALVETISQQTDWSGIDIPTFQKFTRACRIELTNSAQMKRVETYLRGKKVNGQRIPCPFQYLKSHPEWPTYYLPMMQKYRESQLAKLKASRPM